MKKISIFISVTLGLSFPNFPIFSMDYYDSSDFLHHNDDNRESQLYMDDLVGDPEILYWPYNDKLSLTPQEYEALESFLKPIDNIDELFEEEKKQNNLLPIIIPPSTINHSDDPKIEPRIFQKNTRLFYKDESSVSSSSADNSHDSDYEENKSETSRSNWSKKKALREELNTKNRPFECPQCERFFKKKYHLDQHFNTTHSEKNSYFCDKEKCNESFKYRNDLSLRISQIHESKNGRPWCHECKKYFSTRNNLKQHQQNIHENARSFTCTFSGCYAIFKQNSKLTRHIKETHNRTLIMCKECGKTYSNKGNLNKHIRASHKETSLSR